MGLTSSSPVQRRGPARPWWWMLPCLCWALTGYAHPPLQLFVALTPPGGTLQLEPGTYSGPVVIDRPITIEGSGRAIIDGGGEGTVVSVVSDAVTLRGLRIGPGIDRENDLGAMVSVGERDKILALLDEARSEGAAPEAVSDTPESGAFIAPHVVRGVQHGSSLTRQEVFGPVVPIVEIGSDDEAIAMANDTEYGLISYVYAGDKGRGISVAKRMESGMVAIDRGLASDPAAPFGGMKDSGLGREGAREGIVEYLETKMGGFSI